MSEKKSYYVLKNLKISMGLFINVVTLIGVGGSKSFMNGPYLIMNE